MNPLRILLDDASSVRVSERPVSRERSLENSCKNLQLLGIVLGRFAITRFRGPAAFG